MWSMQQKHCCNEIEIESETKNILHDQKDSYANHVKLTYLQTIFWPWLVKV